MFVHYFIVITNHIALKIIQSTEDLFISMIFLLICYLFCKNSSKVLPGRKKWLTYIKVAAVICAVLSVFFAIYRILNSSDVYGSCKTNVYFGTNFIKALASSLFLVALYCIAKSLKNLSPNYPLEAKVILENKKRA